MSRSTLAAGIRHLRGVMAAQQHHQQSDEQLLHAFAAERDDSAFAALVRRHGPMVMGVCRRVLGHQQDAEDAFQATFLVLARGIGSLRRKTALTSFLHGTAYRLALNVRRAAARRRKYEGQAPTPPFVDPAEELSWREVRMLLDEEIARLPDRCRSVFILCGLENLSQAETGRRLGLKERTVSNRLAEARGLLQQRLSRRGVALTAVLAVTALTAPPASALPNVPLTTLTAETVSPAVASLAKSASSILNIDKTKMMAALLLAAVTGGSLMSVYRPASGSPAATSEPPAAKAEDKSKTASSSRPTAKPVQIHGRVFGPDGQPKEGTKLLLLSGDEKPRHLGDTVRDGTFSIALPKGSHGGWLIAQAMGCGIDFRGVSKNDAGKSLELRLVKDQVIRCRVVNTEGKPIPGVRVTAEMMEVFADNSLNAFLIDWKKRHFMSGLPGGVKSIWSGLGGMFSATTDSDGRFVLHGIGAERFARLRLRGEGIADSEQFVVNRNGFDPKPYNQATLDNIPKGQEHLANRILLQGPEFTVVAEAEKPIRGTVKAADTGKGLEAVAVRLTGREGGALVDIELSARTDAQGRYEIRGARKARRYRVEVANNPTTGYLGAQVWAGDTPGYQPVAADITLKKGVIITGRIIDQSTGKPIRGFVMATPLVNNPFVKNYPSFNSWNMPSTGDDFTFRVLTIPGHVLLMGGPHDWPNRLLFKDTFPDPKYPQYFTKDPHFPAYYNPDGSMSPPQGNYCKVLEIKPDAAIVKQDIVLERASVLPVQIQDADGKPLTGVWVAGQSFRDWYPAHQCEKAECPVYQLERGKPRLLAFFHPGRKLAGTLTLKGDEKPPVVAKLRPAAAIKGRLLDADGKPLAGVVVSLNYSQRTAREVHNVIHRAKQIVSDSEGAFTIEEMIPGSEVGLRFQQGKRHFDWTAKAGESTTVQLKPGESRDLGAMPLKRKRE